MPLYFVNQVHDSYHNLSENGNFKWFPFSDKLEKPNNLTDFSGGCKSKVNQTFDWLTSKQPQTSHLVATVKTEQLFSGSDMSEN